ncbi:MAG: recombinase family protein [Oscillospiraceae bacterium]|nr:recombinase family protein [Oscillospiraceae bacterium]
MAEKIYGYVRVSTKEQNETRQLVAMREFGVAEENIIIEKCSGKDFRRPRYQLLVESLLPGDVLVVKSIDRLGRNYTEILEQWNTITKSREAAIVVLDMPLLDTRQRRDLTGTLIVDIVLQLLSYVAQTERESIRQRQTEGIAAAIGRGVQFGRRRLPLPDGFEEMAQLWKKGLVSSRAASGELGISRDTFLRRAKEYDSAQSIPHNAL